MSRWHTTEFDFLPERAFQPRGFKGGMTLEGGGKGGGGGSAPPPDPRLVTAQIKSLDTQDRAIEAMLKNNERMEPIQMEQMRFGLDTSRKAWDQAQADREWTLGRRGQLTEVQDALIKDAGDFNQDARAAQLEGLATADINRSFDQADAIRARGLSRMGVNPMSGASLDSATQTSLARASALAAAGTQVREAARQEGLALKKDAANMLAGYPAMGMQATGSGAGFGGLGLSYANSGAAGINAGLSAAGGLAGNMGSNATGMWNAQANYKLGSDKAASEGGSMLGTVAGMAAGYFTGGLASGAAKKIVDKW